MAFSIFNKKDEPAPKPAAKPAARPASNAAPASKAAPVAAEPALSTKIDQIEAEMDSLDFTSLTAPAAAPAAPPAPAPLAPPPSPAAVTPTPSAPSFAPPPIATNKPANKPVIERGFTPPALGSKPIRRPVAPAAATPKTPATPAPPRATPPAPVPSSAAASAPKAPSPPPVPAPAVAPTPKPAARPLPLQGVSSVMMMEVEVSPFEAAPVLEEAAILFANMQEDAAVTALRDAIAGGKLPVSARQHAWLLLFDLFENLGRKDDFEAAAIDFAVAFETSPPAYVDRSGVKDPTLATGSGQYIAITGALDETCAPQLDQLDKAADKNRVLRIEFGKITAVAGAGCELLLDKLASLRKSKHDLVLSNAEHLIKLLNESVETGRRDPESLWMLLLEMYQLQNMQTAFEETALNYCITYEVSPPSWVQPAKAAAHTQPQGPTTLEVPQDAFYLKGTIDGAATKTFDELSAYAADKERVVIDMFSVKRIDFMAAGAFLNAVSTLRTQAKQVELRSPSPLISALLISMGFNNQASFTRRGK